MNKRVKIRVSGFVQGVNFRYYTKVEAENLGLTGFVKNEPDGSVTIVALGEEENLKKLIDWTKKGPLWAKVEKIEVDWQVSKEEFERFEVIYG